MAATSTSFAQVRIQADPFVEVCRERIGRFRRTTMPRDATRPIHTLLIDNYDSYTYNLYHYLAEANGGT